MREASNLHIRNGGYFILPDIERGSLRSTEESYRPTGDEEGVALDFGAGKIERGGGSRGHDRTKGREEKEERKEGREGRRKDVGHSKGFSLSLIPRTWSNELMENAVHTSGS